MSLTVPEIADYVTEDFQARSVAATVLYGDWKASEHGAADVVIFGLGTGDIQPPAPTHAQGMVPFVDESDNDVGAVNLADLVQQVQVWVHAAPPDDRTVDEWAREAQKSTMALFKSTFAALSRCTSASFGMVANSVKWPRPEQAEFTYGALMTFLVTVRIPVLDDVHQFLRDPDGNSDGTVSIG